MRLEWRDFPYLGQESMDAAVAARAAGEQGKFWEYHDLLYERQGQVSGGFSEENLVGFARELGLDVGRFEADLKSEGLAAAVQEDFVGGQNSGIQGTPSFVVNGRVLVGAQPVEAYAQVIEEEVRKAEGAP